MVSLIEQDFLKNKKLYKNVEKSLRKRLGSGVPIEHVGSTAIPNMCGKNIIDILVGVKGADEFEKVKSILLEEGYFAGKHPTEIYQFFASSEKETGDGDVHIHLVVESTERYKEFVLLRDFLLSHPDEAREYANCKKELLAQGVTDRKEYRAKKSEYVTQMIERAKLAK